MENINFKVITKPLNICGTKIRVVDVIGYYEKKELYGQWTFKDQTIRIDASLSGYPRKQTMLHEMLHVCEDFTGHKLSEQQIDGFASCILNILQNNPEWVEWLQAKK